MLSPRSAPGLALSVVFPDPSSLPDLAEMTPMDIVRELVAVAHQRDAETVAALESIDKPARAAPVASAPAGDAAHSWAGVALPLTWTPPQKQLPPPPPAGSRFVGGLFAKLTSVLGSGSNNSSSTASSAPPIASPPPPQPPASTLSALHLPLSPIAAATPGSSSSASGQLAEAEGAGTIGGGHGEVRGILELVSRAGDAIVAGDAVLRSSGGFGSARSAGAPSVDEHADVARGAMLAVDAGLEETAGIAKQYFQARGALTLSAQREEEVTPLPTMEAASQPPRLRLALSHSTLLQARTLAYDVPRPLDRIVPGRPCVGSAPARDALTALKAMLHAPAPAVPLVSTSTTTVFASSTSASSSCVEQENVPLCASTCRPLVHSHLTPAQSEARVQSLITHLKVTTGYDFTPPLAPLAQTRLGSTYAVPSSASSSSASALSNSGRSIHMSIHSSSSSTLSTPSSSRRRGGGASAFAIAPTPIVLGDEPMTARKAAQSSSLASAPGGVTFSLSTDDARNALMAASPTPVKGAPGGFVGGNHNGESVASGNNSSIGPLLSPVPSVAAPAGAFTPAPSTRRTISRFLSSQDLSRAGTSPGHFDREYHVGVLTVMQSGLTAMVTQRREEEGHMLAATRVKPSKHPQGGYCYMNVDTGRPVVPAAYEHVYLAEVHFGQDYINQQATLAWAADAAATEQARAAWTPIEQARAIERCDAARNARTSWWSQDVDEGLALLPSRPPPLTSTLINNGVVMSGGVSVGAALLRFVREWAQAEATAAREREAAAAAAVAASMNAPVASPAAVVDASSAASPGVVPHATLAALIQAAAPGAVLLATHADKLLRSSGSGGIDGLSIEDEATLHPLFSAIVQALAAHVCTRGVVTPASLSADLAALVESGSLVPLMKEAAAAVAEEEAVALAAAEADAERGLPTELPFCLVSGSGELQLQAGGVGGEESVRMGGGGGGDVGGSDMGGGVFGGDDAREGLDEGEADGDSSGVDGVGMALFAGLSSHEAYQELSSEVDAAEEAEVASTGGEGGGGGSVVSLGGSSASFMSSGVGGVDVAQQLFQVGSDGSGHSGSSGGDLTKLAAGLSSLHLDTSNVGGGIGGPLHTLPTDATSAAAAAAAAPGSPPSSRLAPSLLRVFSPIHVGSGPSPATASASSFMRVGPFAASLLMREAAGSSAAAAHLLALQRGGGGGQRPPLVSPLGVQGESPNLLQFPSRVSPRPLPEEGTSVPVVVNVPARTTHLF